MLGDRMESKSRRLNIEALVLLSILLLKVVDLQTNCVQGATVRILERAVEIAPDSERLSKLLEHRSIALSYTDFGLHNVGMHDYVAAIIDWKTAIRKEPHNVGAYLSFGQACYDANEFEAGRNAFNQALQIDPNSIDAYKGLAIYYWEIEDNETAVKTYEKIVEIDPEYQHAHYMLAIEYAILGMKEESDAEMEYFSTDDFSEEKPGVSALWHFIGNLYRDNGSREFAIPAYICSLDLAPNRAETRFNLAQEYLHTGNREKALAEYEVLKGLDAESAEVLLELITHSDPNEIQ